MPQIAYCKVCKFKLYDGLDLESPENIAKMHHGYCPMCHRSLDVVPDRVKFIPLEEIPDWAHYVPGREMNPKTPLSSNQTANSSADGIQKTLYRENGKKD